MRIWAVFLVWVATGCYGCCVSLHRDQVIIEYLQREGPSSVPDIAKFANVSESSIRRDLAHLAEMSMIKRFSNGAMLVGDEKIDEDLGSVSARRRKEKFKIAKLAAGLVSPGQMIYIDIGSTNLKLAQQLQRYVLTIVTPSLPAVTFFAKNQKSRVISTGGAFHREYRSFGGSLATSILSQVHVDIAFIGTSGVANNGVVRDTSLEQMEVKVAALERCDKKVLLADHSKFPGKGKFSVAPLMDFDAVVSDQALPERLSAICTQYDVQEIY